MGLVNKCNEALGKDLYNNLCKQKLNLKQITFIVDYISNGFNGTRAYMKTYKTCKSVNTAGVEAYNTLRNPKISEGIRLIFNDWLAEKKD